MVASIQVVFDALDPKLVGTFWQEALDYTQEPPPGDFETWDEALVAGNIPEQNWNDAYVLIDPTGAGPRIYIQQVPERKELKNRVHLDVRLSERGSDPAKAWPKVEKKLAELVALGATRIDERTDEWGGHWVVMADPEGNEFCVL